MKILLAGYKGFVGKRLAEILRAAGHDVWHFERGASLKWGPICHADLVINAAGEISDEDKMTEDNVVFAALLANACYVFQKRLIHIGSISERTTTKRYGATKKVASDLVLNFARESFAKFCIISPATVFGPGDHKDSFMSKIWDAHELDVRLKLVEEGRDWVHVDDLCRAIQLVAESDPNIVSGQIFEVGYGVSISNLTMLLNFETLVGRHIPHEVIARTGNHWCADTIALDDLGWETKVKLRPGIQSFIDYKTYSNRVWLGAEA